jgi:hypothetical protein
MNKPFKTLLETKLQTVKQVNNVLLNAESGQSISSKAVGISIQNVLEVLEEVARELKEIKQKEVSHA